MRWLMATGEASVKCAKAYLFPGPRSLRQTRKTESSSHRFCDALPLGPRYCILSITLRCYCTTHPSPPLVFPWPFWKLSRVRWCVRARDTIACLPSIYFIYLASAYRAGPPFLAHRLSVSLQYVPSKSCTYFSY